jgi:putative tricarboxylic transport membrane protein
MVLMVLFGIIGYFMKKLGYEPAPVVLAFILGKMMEPALRRSLMMSGGSFAIFFTRPISLGLIIVAGILLISPFILKRENKFRRRVTID